MTTEFTAAAGDVRIVGPYGLSVLAASSDQCPPGVTGSPPLPSPPAGCWAGLGWLAHPNSGGPSDSLLSSCQRRPRPEPLTALAWLLMACLLVVAFAAPAGAVADPADRLRDPAAEARAGTIGRELRCLVCQNQSIEDSDADLAKDLRRIVREQVTAGRTDAEVMRYVHDRYGDFVLLRPPVNAGTIALWASPAIALGAGLLLVVGLRRRNRIAAAPPALTAAERERLARIEAGGAA